MVTSATFDESGLFKVKFREKKNKKKHESWSNSSRKFKEQKQILDDPV